MKYGSRSVGLYLSITIISSFCVWFDRSAEAQLNPIQIENALPGDDGWQVENAASNHEIEGYGSATSVNTGGSIDLLVNTVDPTYTIDVYRLGWYGGLGGRHLLGPITRSGVRQITPSPDPVTGMVECHWASPYTLTASDAVNGNWISGVYIALLTGSSGLQSEIIFVVRNDSYPSALLFQSSVATFEAYNRWGGKSLYLPVKSPAVNVSFDRPYDDQNGTGQYFHSEYQMSRFLEREGYDVTYSTDVDTHTSGAALLNHKGFLILGKDEYWSYEMRQNVENALAHGVSLGFFSADDCYWQIRYQPDSLGNANRTVVGYKERAANDPDAQNPSTYYLVTTKWRDPHVTLPGNPEERLIGVQHTNSTALVDGDIVIADPSQWPFIGTGVSNHSRLRGILGYEVDNEQGNQPSNTVLLGKSSFFNGKKYEHADMVTYQAASGATVFATGSINWSSGLDDFHSSPTDIDVSPVTQQITRNVLGQMTGQ